jgi:hypothetical protein
MLRERNRDVVGISRGTLILYPLRNNSIPLSLRSYVTDNMRELYYILAILSLCSFGVNSVNYQTESQGAAMYPNY